MIRVKICGLTCLEDARAAVACGADLLGFVYVPTSPRCVSPAMVRSIVTTLRDEGCTTPVVGVFANQPAAEVQAAAEGVLDVVQLHGDESPAYARSLGRPVWIARSVSDRIPWQELAAYDAVAWVLDAAPAAPLQNAPRGGTGHTWNWQALAGAPTDAKIVLAGGLHPGNVAEAIATARRLGVIPWAVDVSSGVERAPGRKDLQRMQAFVQAVKGA
ncbi:MAG: phosphoribosylanthranilate isomerase [Anaerolineales bacterium]